MVYIYKTSYTRNLFFFCPTRSNRKFVAIREEVKELKLSFTEIAKTVGERWQQASSAQKEPYDTEAAAAKEAHALEMAKYKRTSHYREYQKYLAEFKSKNPDPSAGMSSSSALPPYILFSFSARREKNQAGETG